MTTNVVEAWHYSLKTYAGGKEVMKTFPFSGVISHVLTIGDQWAMNVGEFMVQNPSN